MTVLNTTLLTPISTSSAENDNGIYFDTYCYSKLYQSIFLSLTTLSGVFGLLGNGKVIWLLGFCFKRNPFTTYVLNLAIADFCTVLMVSIIFLIFFNVTDNDNTIHGIMMLLSVSSFFFTHSASIYLLTAISTERCLSVLFPIWYRCRRPQHSSATVSFLLWVLSGLLSGIRFLFSMLTSYQSNNTMIQIMCIVNFLIFTPLMIGSALILLIKICCSSQRRHPARMHAMILITLLFFLIFAIPLSSYYFICFNYYYFSFCFEITAFLFASFNSSINPLIYYLIGRDRKRRSRESVKVAFQRLFTDSNDRN